MLNELKWDQCTFFTPQSINRYTIKHSDKMIDEHKWDQYIYFTPQSIPWVLLNFYIVLHNEDLNNEWKKTLLFSGGKSRYFFIIIFCYSANQISYYFSIPLKEILL